MDFSKLYHKYHKDVMKVVRKYEHNKDTQEDLAQDIFLEVWKSLDSFDGESNIGTWIHSIALNVCRHWSRDQGRRVPTEGSRVSDLDEALQPTNSFDEAADRSRPLEDHASPEDFATAEQSARATHNAMQRMPSGLRIALSLSIEGMSHQEIADEMNCTYELAKKRVFRARERLKEVLHV